jgi:PAS domain S-box-containing protein
MDDKRPTYEELQARLAQAESTLEAICSDSVDAVIGQKGAYLLRLNEMEKARKQMEQALQESEQRFRALFEHSPDAVLFTSADGTVEVANPAACVMFGYGEQQFRNMGRSVILDDDSRLAAALKERQETGRVKAVELTAIRKGGEKFPVEFDSVILPVEPVRSFMIIRDVSERKEAEVVIRKSFERLRLAANAARLGVFDWDIPSDTPVWENPRIYEIFGHAPNDRPVNLNQLVNGFYPYLPDKEVAEGESWEDSKERDEDGMHVTSNAKYTFKEMKEQMGRNCAKVEAEVETGIGGVSTTPMGEYEAEGEGEGEAEFYFDPADAIVVWIKEKIEIKMDMTPVSGGDVVETTISFQVERELL